MSTFKIIKKGTNDFWHWFNSDAKKVAISSFAVVLEEVSQTFSIVYLNGANVPQQAVNVLDIEVIDETDTSDVETFTNVIDLRARLVQLGYTAYLIGGGIDNITGLIAEGTNVTITGDGTLANPYVISATGGGAVDSVNGLTGDVVLDATDVGAEPAKGVNDNYVTDAQLVVIENTSGTNSGDNTENTTSNAYADAKVEDAIVDGVTDKAPSQNAVFDALAFKADKSDFEDWTSFAGSSTIVGWTTPNITFLQYTRTGKVVTIRGRVTGVSNSVNTSITIPFTLANLGAGQGDFSLLFANNSVSSATAGCIVGSDNSNLIQFFRDGVFTTWTASGTKTIAFLSTFIIQ